MIMALTAVQLKILNSLSALQAEEKAKHGMVFRRDLFWKHHNLKVADFNEAVKVLLDSNLATYRIATEAESKAGGYTQIPTNPAMFAMTDEGRKYLNEHGYLS